MKILLEIVKHPRKFDMYANLPLRFDAAEQLLDYWNEMSESDRKIVSGALIYSGKYK